MRPPRGVLHFEHMHEPLAPVSVYRQRQIRNALFFVELIGGSLLIGTIGYHVLGPPPLGWIDSLLNASMILTGMGPMDKLESNAGKLFESAYAIFSGVMFLTSVGVLLSPAIHRALHHFHLDPPGEPD